jgi:hypothetical protein
MNDNQPQPEETRAETIDDYMPPPAPRRRAPRAWTGRPLRIGPPFWTITGILSLVVNLVLIVLLLSLANQLFTLKKLVQEQVLGGLYENFVRMDQAHIRTTIPVNTSVAAQFDLPLQTNTVVVLTEPTLLENASVASLTIGGLGSGMTITNAPATILLAEGTRLPVALDLTVPVDQQIPVSLMVNVDIPLSETDLHQPFVGLQEVIRPYYLLLQETPDSWSDVICGPEPGALCQTFFH